MDNPYRTMLIVEGEEEEDYWCRLQNLGLILSRRELLIVNAHSISKIPAVFDNKYRLSARYPIFVFCDTDEGYERVKKTVDDIIGEGAHKRLVYFASPCSMTVWLAHFSMGKLKTIASVNKKKNGELLRSLGVSFTGIYDAKKEQREQIMKQITVANFENMKRLVSTLPATDKSSPATNILELLAILSPNEHSRLDEVIAEIQAIEKTSMSE